MGADSFVNIYAAKSGSLGVLTETFNAAVDRARWDYGHAGYTGTIAEKHSFRFIARCENEEAALALAHKMLDEEDPRIADKWGPAGAITYPRATGAGTLDARVIEAVIFFGWASS